MRGLSLCDGGKVSVLVETFFRHQFLDSAVGQHALGETDEVVVA